ncbi:hypothetical protein BDP27DRAFT_1418102 [Rhodocollybia butyracea]|uniref:Uncharacterized protein n=1 Tax=Rhodocollybia butyracea TaxID=206335 RepID=A0A9P5Q2P1_9AGAR|nr:hypothetical protein BDP27DRAFT_1418102 [Rhodocollybia butyracea]
MTETENIIQTFFEQYPEFTYDPASETMAQFWQLCNHMGWAHNTSERKEALGGIRNAIAQQFNAFYGGSAEDLNGWHNLYRALRVPDVPDSVAGCKALVPTIHVNICDLVDYSLHGQEMDVALHGSQEELAEYSRKNGKIYPRENAYAEGLLRFLLREIYGKYQGRRREGAGGRRRDRGRRGGKGGRRGRAGRRRE